MITVTENDIGRTVVYTPSHGKREYGVISSFNELYVFVRYGSQVNAQATSRENLEYHI